MTRFLSESLQAPEPAFHNGLKQLEAGGGYPNADIRLTSEARQAVRRTLHELNLDPSDTTPHELYRALQARFALDDARLTRTLQTLAATHISAQADPIAGMVHALQQLPDSRRCFAVKAASFKTLIKRLPPKKAMKQLGYRSLDSLLKHETPASIMTAATLAEDANWLKRLHAQYKRLDPRDFEDRNIMISEATFKKAPQLTADNVQDIKHNVLSFKELGVVVLLPLPAHAPAGAVTASLSLALHELNEIRAASTFIKLSQVRSNFGEVVAEVVRSEPVLSSQLLDQPMPWRLVQRYYAHQSQHFNEAVFEPHIQLADMAWHGVEKALATIEPSLSFWQKTAHVGLLHERGPVSCNIVDVALSYCNKLPFERRVSAYYQRSLWHELLSRYLQPAAIEQTILQELQPHLATEPALA